MAYFTEPELKRVTLLSNPAYWVDVLTEYKWGDVKKFSTPDATGSIEFATTADTFLLTAIKAWNLDDGAGNIVEITQENLDKVDRDDLMFVINEASAYAVESEDSKKNSSKSSLPTPAAQQ
jgi:hypothetical protein